MTGAIDEKDRFNDRFRSFSSLSFIDRGLLFEAIMEICPRHIGNQERPGLLTLLSSLFPSAVFLWQLANVFLNFCDDGTYARDIIGYPELLNYIQLPKFCVFARRIMIQHLHSGL